MLYNGSSFFFFPREYLKSLNYTKSNKKIISDIDKKKKKANK